MGWFRHLYVQVLLAIVAGVLLGIYWPETGTQLKPLSDGFIRLVRMLVAPVIFLTVVIGIASMEDTNRLGAVGLKALLYFEAVTTLALVIGLLVVNVVQPGTGLHINPAQLDVAGLQAYTTGARPESVSDFILNIIPLTFFAAFAQGEILQVLFVALLFGVALSHFKASNSLQGSPLLHLLEAVSKVFMKMIHYIMQLAPLAAFAAMGYTIGKFGIAAMQHMLGLMACLYLTCGVFVFGVLALIARLSGLNFFKLLRYLREEFLIVLSTSSSEAVLPRMLEKMEALGCKKSIVGIVLPAGYSFNLDGTCIYLTLAAVFLAQATDTALTLWQQLGLLGILLVTSKGAAAVTGGGFITLAATLAATGAVPVESMVLLLGIDRFMSEARALTNLAGNAVATWVVARWEGGVNMEQAEAVLNVQPTLQAGS